MHLSTDELIHLAPRLRPYLRSSMPNWRDIVDASDWLRHDLDISKSLWGKACIAMGREQAAIALALVSAKPAAHFRTTPGGYFHGMVAKAYAGELNLGRTIWGLRSGSHARHSSPERRQRPWRARTPSATAAEAHSTRVSGRAESILTACERHQQRVRVIPLHRRSARAGREGRLGFVLGLPRRPEPECLLVFFRVSRHSCVRALKAYIIISI